MKSLNFFWCVEVTVTHVAVMGCSAARCCFLQTVHKGLQKSVIESATLRMYIYSLTSWQLLLLPINVYHTEGRRSNLLASFLVLADDIP